MGIKQTLKCLAICFLLQNPLLAHAASTASILSGNFDASSKQERVEIARDLISEIQKLTRFLSSPKPENTTWLKKEREAISNLKDSDAVEHRYARLIQTPEYQHEKLHGMLTMVHEALLCVASPSTTISREIMCWSVASFHLTDHSVFNEAIPILINSGWMPNDLDKHTKAAGKSLGYGFYFEAWGRGIQEHVIIPYLKSQAK